MTGFTRRTTSLGLAALAAGLARADKSTPDDWLGETDYINHSHRAVLAAMREATTGASTAREKAIQIHTFVSERIVFGFGRGFWNQRASDVLSAGRGYCNTKSTLFVALLRAAGIPSRQVFVDIDAQVLAGILDPGTPYVDHSYVEAFIDGAWVATDAYIVDPPLMAGAKARLSKEGGVLGYGVHKDGTCAWDALTPAFSQYPMTHAEPPGTKVWGAYADVGDFYAKADGVWNRLNALMRAAMPVLASGANQRADALRG